MLNFLKYTYLVVKEILILSTLLSLTLASTIFIISSLPALAMAVAIFG